jgi:hypothetical protein
MKKALLILLAFALVFGLVFTGCPNGSTGGTKPPPPPPPPPGGVKNPIVDGASFLKISGRSNNWDTIDIKAGKAEATANYTANKAHTITVYGNTTAGTDTIRFANTDSPYGTHGTSDDWATADGQGDFTLEYEFTWANITDAAQNLRIQLPANVPSFTVYEIVINDGTDDIYKMSEDEDIQGAAAGIDPIVDDTTGSTWFLKAGSPVIQVIVPGEDEPPPVTCDNEDCDCEECPGPSCTCGVEVGEEDEALFAAVTALKATDLFINEWYNGTCRMSADNTTGIISRNDSNGTDSSLLSIDLSKLTPPLTIAETNTIKIAVAVLTEGQVKLTAKLPGTNSDLTPGTYLDVTTATEIGFFEKTISIAAERYIVSGTWTSPAKLSFQDNGGGFWQMKIKSITVE